MGTWGPRNLDNDGALDVLCEYSDQLVNETLQLAASKAAADCDEYDYDKLFVNFEIIFALERSCMLRTYPEPERVKALKAKYFAAWDSYVAKNCAPWAERRVVIEETFDRFCSICENEKLRREQSPQWVEVERPTLAEIAADLVLTPHLIFGEFHISIPATWVTGPAECTETRFQRSLIRHLAAADEITLRVEEFDLKITDTFFASGSSLVPADVNEEHDPYIFLARVRVRMPKNVISVDSYRLASLAQDALAPLFHGEGEHVSGVLRIPELEDFQFDGMESFRHLKKGPPWGTRLFYGNLYFHRLAPDMFLLLEFGSVHDNVDSSFPDAVLVDHLVRSMKWMTKPTSD